MLSLVKLFLGLLALAGVIAYGAQNQNDRLGHDHSQPQHITTDPNGGTFGPP